MKKFIKVMATASLLTSVAVPVASVVSPAVSFADSGVFATSVPTIKAATAQKLGTVKITIPKGTRTNGQSLTLNLPSGVEVPYDSVTPANNVLTATNTFGTNVNQIVVDGDLYSGGAAKASATYTSKTQIKVSLTADVLTTDSNVYVQLDNVDASGASDGAVNVSVDASPASGIPTGKVVIANVTSADSAAITTQNTKTANDGFTFDLTVKENALGSVANGDKVKVKLPTGYKWATGIAGGANITFNYGSGIAGTIVRNTDQEIEIDFTNAAQTALTSFNVTGLAFGTDPGSDSQKDGDIVASVSASGIDTDASQITVGTYGEYAVNLTSDAPKSVVAGQLDQDLADFHVKEGLQGSLVTGAANTTNRTIVLHLPDGAKFTADSLPATNNGVTVTRVSTAANNTSNSTQTLKYAVTGTATDKVDLKFTGLKVAVDPNFTGDLNVTVDGTAGVTGTVKLGTVTPVATAKASSVKDVVIGQGGQALDDFTITEGTAGAFQKNR